MKKIIFGLLILLLVLGIFVGISYGTYNNVVNVDTIYRGISVDGIDVSNLTIAEAMTKVVKEGKVPDKSLILTYDNYKFEYPYSQLGYKIDYGYGVLEAYKYGRDGSPGDRFLQVTKLSSNPVNIDLEGSFSNEEVSKVIEDLNNVISRPAEDAKFSVVGGEKQVVEAIDGLNVNNQKTRDLIYKSLESGEEVKIAVDKNPADLYASAFDHLKGPIGSFETDYSSSILNRKKNIQKAAEILNGLVIKPKEQISFNKVIGEISEAAGLFPATVINDGNYDTGVGGGICQVSTTLYNAAVKADLSIDERRNHSRPVNYVPRGTDAAIAIGYLDLKISNPFDFPIYIGAEADDKKIRFTIIGDTDIKDYDVSLIVEKVEDITSETISRNNSNLAQGQSLVAQKGYNGSIYQSYKVKTKDGEVIEKDKYYRSTYPARNTIIDVGTKVVEESIEDLE